MCLKENSLHVIEKNIYKVRESKSKKNKGVLRKSEIYQTKSLITIKLYKSISSICHF